MPTLVQFGGGNIGRSFLGQLFSRGGYEVVFVDIDQDLISEFNSKHAYRVVIKRGDQADEILNIENVRAVNALDKEAVAREVAGADLLATSVGQRALTAIIPTIAQGLEMRRSEQEDRPLDIIIAENLRAAADFFREKLSDALPTDYPLDELVGLVETSIGKMVPIMRAEDMKEDRLWVFAEAYNSLILDKRGFKNPIPNIQGLVPKENMQAYVDRKLFIHNLGHAASAYFGYQAHPSATYIWEVLNDANVMAKAHDCMVQAAQALIKEYPAEFNTSNLGEHIEDLLFRFRNKALGDTIFRVGRDLYRKLSKEDRLIGAMLLGARQKCVTSEIAQAVRAAMLFRGTDEHGNMFAPDKEFAEKVFPQGVEHVLSAVCGLSSEDSFENAVMNDILCA